MALLTTKQKRMMNRAGSITGCDLGDRTQYLNTDGSYSGPLSDSIAFIADTGGLAAYDLAYVSGIDATTGYIKLKKAQANAAATSSDLYWSPSAVTSGATGYARKAGTFTSTLTNSGAIGDPVYLSAASAGAVTGTIPSGDNFVVEVGTFASTGATAVVHVDLGGEAIPVHTHVDKSQGGTLSVPALAGTTGTVFTVFSGGATARLALDTNSASGNFLMSLSPANLGQSCRITLPDPGGATDSIAYTALAQTFTNKTIAGTVGSSFTVLNGGATAKIKLDTAAATGNFTHSIVCPNLLADKSNTLPTGTGAYYALTDQADGSIVTTASTGTSNATFAVATNLVLSSSGLTGVRTFTFPDATGTVATLAATQTLAAKTLTSPVINGATLSGTLTISTPTVSGTWTNLGAVTTVDINGGTVDATAIGGSTPSSGAFTTLGATGAITLTGTATVAGVTARSAADNWDLSASTGTFDSPHSTNTIHGNIASHGNITFDFSGSNTTFKTSTGDNTLGGDTTIAAGKDLVFAQGAGYLQMVSTTSGGIKIAMPADFGFEVTLDGTKQTSGVATLGIPDLAGGDYDFVVTGKAQTIADVKTYTSNPVVSGIDAYDSTLALTGKVGSSSVGGSVTLTAGAGNGAFAGGVITLTTGAGVNGSGATAGTAPGTLTATCGAAGTSGTGAGGTGGAIAITATAGGATTGAAGAAGAGGGITLTTGVGGADGEGGSGTGGVGGTLALVAGNGGAGFTKGNGGAITITPGQAGGAGATGGGLTVDAGAANGGTAGAILIGGTDAESVTIGRSTKITRILGTARADALASGVSGTAGVVNIFPSTGSRGSIQIQCADNTSDHKLILTNAAVNAADKTVTFPAATCTLVGKDTTDTFTNKTIDAAGTGNSITNLSYVSPAVGATVDDATVGLTVVLMFTITDADLTDGYTVPAGKKFRVLDAWAVKTVENGGAADTVQVFSGANPITNAMSLNINDQFTVRAGTIDDAYTDVAAGTAINVTGVAGTTSAESRVTVLGMWITP
jgi:hypothetical protein